MNADRQIYRNIPGHLNPDDADLLYALAQRAAVGIIEIGSYHGKSTIALALGSKAGNKIPVYAVDPFDPFIDKALVISSKDKEALFINLVNAGVCDVVKVINMRAEKASRCFASESADLLFVDGDHDRTGADWNEYEKILTSGGVVAFHDIDRPNISSFVNGIDGKEVDCIKKTNQMWIAKKK